MDFVDFGMEAKNIWDRIGFGWWKGTRFEVWDIWE
jgi:hypothetical protein